MACNAFYREELIAAPHLCDGLACGNCNKPVAMHARRPADPHKEKKDTTTQTAPTEISAAGAYPGRPTDTNKRGCDIMIQPSRWVAKDLTPLPTEEERRERLRKEAEISNALYDAETRNYY